MAYASKRFLLLSESQQQEAKKRKRFIEKYLLETDPKQFLEPTSWESFCGQHCIDMKIVRPEREEFAKWCFDLKMWQGDLFVLAPQPPQNRYCPKQCANS
ncbi:hypothetical protein A9264_09905 [Vibrio sp. UCD-FRSSP16_10]|uniref:hypothetical protein n=1 Tax=unclassified Vibrio TaxID=2614977 RepID=UPI000801908F|nr:MULTISPECIES: hypothetical protein [unclassified Vibrio]OBT17032.1 hypothetical protein A9260_10130 [Vibrio sp. UCD-FRSSP16_30]OBT22023.1 hypothetical protein A9264_09905 [Vibrio sp. UCD-FRSSP16_10]